MSKDNGVKLHQVETEAQPSKSIVIPIAAGVICLVVLMWCADHIYGNCLDFSHVFTYCSLAVTN